MLTSEGKVSEPPIACFFMVREGQLITRGVTSNILESVTRDSLIALHEDAGYPVVQREIDRSERYLADEAFICGTGQEILPVTSLDRFDVGNGDVAPITRELQREYFDAVRGRNPARSDWLTTV